MSVEDCEQDCTVYIQQLKSDNPSLKLNAASKITFIASALGPSRLQDELIPYLIQIIDQMDNDIEFLSKVAEQMYELRPHCRSAGETHILMEPLFKLASLDQPVVRDRAVKSLEQLARDQSAGFFKEHYFPLIKRMASQEATSHSSRVAVCPLIPICYPHVSPTLQQELRSIFSRLALKDDSPMVRRSLCQSIEAYSDVVSKEIMRSDVLEIWQKFIVDIIDVIRVKALETVPIICRFFKKEEIGEKFVKLMQKVDGDKKSWRIRYSLVEAWANILGFVEKGVIRKEIKESFEQLLKDAQYEVRSIAVLKLPLLCPHLTKQTVTDDFLPHLDRLSKQTVSAHVRQSVIESLPAVMKHVNEDQVTSVGVTIIESLLKDDSIPVRIALVQRLKDIIEVIGVPAAKRSIIPLITTNSTSAPQDNKWRYRVAIVEKFVELCKVMGFQAFEDTIESLLKGFLRDHYYSVREQAVRILGQLAQNLGSKGKSMISSIILQLAKEKNFTFRVAACQAVLGCKTGFGEKELGELFLGVVRELKEEKIPNVLINLCKCYTGIKGGLTMAVRKEWGESVGKWKESKDEDVVYYAGKAE